MNKVKKIKIDPKYRKENGIFVFDIDGIKIPFRAKERAIVYIPFGQIGGNHSHPRKEAFVALGKDMELIWVEDGKKYKVKMNPHGENYLFIISANLPHAVINRSKKEFGILIELADGVQREVKKEDIV